MTTFRLPDVGEGLQEAEVVAWHVGVGDKVVADQPLVSVETDKAVVEIPSPQSGHVAMLHAEPGDIVEVGEPLVDFDEVGRSDAGSVVGSLPDSGPTARPERVRVSPAVRALARRLGVDLTGVAGSGPGGSITSDDVQRAAGGLDQDVGVEPLRGVRRAMDANMSKAHAEVVAATVSEEADIGDWGPDTDTTVRLVRALAVAVGAEPALNVSYLGRDRGRLVNSHVDIGIAVDTPDGLFVPVLRDVANRTPNDLRAGLEAMRRDIEARTVAPEHLSGATISLSNFGVFGGLFASLVIVPPQVAIVGAGRARDRAVARHGQVAVRRVLPVSLTFDHRVVMGAEATRFLVALKHDLEAPT